MHGVKDPRTLSGAPSDVGREKDAAARRHPHPQKQGLEGVASPGKGLGEAEEGSGVGTPLSIALTSPHLLARPRQHLPHARQLPLANQAIDSP